MEDPWLILDRITKKLADSSRDSCLLPVNVHGEQDNLSYTLRGKGFTLEDGDPVPNIPFILARLIQP